MSRSNILKIEEIRYKTKFYLLDEFLVYFIYNLYFFQLYFWGCFLTIKTKKFTN